MHIEPVLCKVNKRIPNSITSYRQRVFETHFGYGNIIYDQPSNESFCEKLESV